MKRRRKDREVRPNYMKQISKQKPDAIRSVFGREKVIIGVIHAMALPGTPQYAGETMKEIIEYAVTGAERYAAGGVDGLILENHGDIPFLKPEDIGHEITAAMVAMGIAVRDRVNLPMGINVLANGAFHALAIAKAVGADFVRVNQWVNAYVANEGLIEGPAAAALRYRTHIGAQDVLVFTDVHVKHGAHAITGDRSLEEQARDAEWSDSDAIISTGERTGDAASLKEIQVFEAVSQLPIVVGSGVSEDNVRDILSVCQGCIVASSLKENGVWWNQVDQEKVRRLVALADEVR